MNVTNIRDIKNRVHNNNLFRHVDCPVLRAWNRAATMFNIQERGGVEGELEDYINKIPHNERQDVFILLMDVKQRGYDTVRREINQKFELNPERPTIQPIKG